MKYVRIKDNIVVEIVPPYTYKPSISYWYNQEFAEQCVEAPDETVIGMYYCQKTGEFLLPENSPLILDNEELSSNYKNLQKENTLLKTQMQFQTERADLLEGALIEIASMVVE